MNRYAKRFCLLLLTGFGDFSNQIATVSDHSSLLTTWVAVLLRAVCPGFLCFNQRGSATQKVCRHTDFQVISDQLRSKCIDLLIDVYRNVFEIMVIHSVSRCFIDDF